MMIVRLSGHPLVQDSLNYGFKKPPAGADVAASKEKAASRADRVLQV